MGFTIIQLIDKVIDKIIANKIIAALVIVQYRCGIKSECLIIFFFSQGLPTRWQEGLHGSDSNEVRNMNVCNVDGCHDLPLGEARTHACTHTPHHTTHTQNIL